MFPFLVFATKKSYRGKGRGGEVCLHVALGRKKTQCVTNENYSVKHNETLTEIRIALVLMVFRRLELQVLKSRLDTDPHAE